MIEGILTAMLLPSAVTPARPNAEGVRCRIVMPHPGQTWGLPDRVEVAVDHEIGRGMIVNIEVASKEPSGFDNHPTYRHRPISIAVTWRGGTFLSIPIEAFYIQENAQGLLPTIDIKRPCIASFNFPPPVLVGGPLPVKGDPPLPPR